MGRTDRAVNFSIVFLSVLASAIWTRTGAPADETTPKSPGSSGSFSKDQVEFFEKMVQPILKARCLKCHGGEEKIRGGLRLSSRAAVLKGGDQGPAVELEKPAESLLLQAINYDELKMPPSGKLPQAEIDVLTKWVEQGLPWAAAIERDAPGAKAADAPPRVDEEARNYWAYRALSSPVVPTVKSAGWVQNPIDAFILSGLEAQGLSPAPPADRIALIRRVFYDLTGLPPSPDDVDAFVSDDSGDAYEQLIDRLLASRQYGEKWGRHWLDLVRFAETHGYERDSAKPFAWRYRDYVIDSFNRDKPYDQFLKEQLAGDELDLVTSETLIATGFYRLGIWDDEPADRLLAKFDVLDGIVSTTGQVVLGMTVGCARCHDHKKDPILQRDYYRLLAFFRDITDMNVKNTRRAATDEDRRTQHKLIQEKLVREAEMADQLERIQRQLARAIDEKQGKKHSSHPAPDLVDLKYRFYRDTWERLPDFDALKYETAGSLPRNLFTLSAASRGEAMGLVFEGRLKAPQSGEYTFYYEATEGVRIIVDGHIVCDTPERGRHQGSGRATLAAGLVPIRLEYFNTDKKPELKIAWEGPGVVRRSLTDESASDGLPILATSRETPQEWAYTLSAPANGWNDSGFDDSAWQRGAAGFGTAGTPGAVVRTVWNTKDIWLRKVVSLTDLPERISLDLHHDDEAEVYLNGRLIFETRGYLTAYKRILLPPAAAQALVAGENVVAVHCHQTVGGQYIDVGLVAAPERDVLHELVLAQGDALLDTGTIEKYTALNQKLEASRKEQIPEPGIEVMCVAERGREKTQVLIRGNPAAQGEIVEPGFPEVLPGAVANIHQRSGSEASSGKRRALAEWLTAADNPLTPRVMANRLWQFHFGRGIVPTPNDFGKLGEPPTHPELLDWLAVELVRAGWRLKPMHKLIMMSSAYRMSSGATKAGPDRDPGNRLFWRFNGRRLAAEEVRDSILAVSGQLNLKSGGPPVFPPIPKEVLAGQSVPGQGWGNSPPDEAARRSVYVHVKRSLLVPILSQHDMADTDSSCAVRFTTTVPTQALGMLNGEFTNDQATKLAERLGRESPGDLARQIKRAIRLTTSRTPPADEIERDAAFVERLQIDAGLSAEKALGQYCLLLLNANEFMYLD